MKTEIKLKNSDFRSKRVRLRRTLDIYIARMKKANKTIDNIFISIDDYEQLYSVAYQRLKKRKENPHQGFITYKGYELVRKNG